MTQLASDKMSSSCDGKAKLAAEAAEALTCVIHRHPFSFWMYAFFVVLKS